MGIRQQWGRRFQSMPPTAVIVSLPKAEYVIRSNQTNLIVPFNEKSQNILINIILFKVFKNI